MYSSLKSAETCKALDNMFICESFQTYYLLEYTKVCLENVCCDFLFIFQIYASDENVSRNHTTWHCQVEESSLMIAHGLYALYK